MSINKFSAAVKSPTPSEFVPKNSLPITSSMTPISLLKSHIPGEGRASRISSQLMPESGDVAVDTEENCPGVSEPMLVVAPAGQPARFLRALSKKLSVMGASVLSTKFY